MKEMGKYKLVLLTVVCVVLGTITAYSAFKKNTEKCLTYMEIQEFAGSGNIFELSFEELQNRKDELLKSIEKTNKDYLHEKYYLLGLIEYINNNDDTAIRFFEQALRYTVDKQGLSYSELDLRIHSALSNLFLRKQNRQLSDLHFKRVKEIARRNNIEKLLCGIYYERAFIMLESKYTVEEVISFTKQSLEYTVTPEHFIRNYIFLSTLYKLQGQYNESLVYTEKALEIAIRSKKRELINNCIISLGENYYLQENFDKAIYIYEKLLLSGYIEDENKLSVYGYLADCYGEEGEYLKFTQYRNKYIELAETLAKSEREQELLWIYSISADREVDFRNLDEAERYFIQAKKIFKNNPQMAYHYMEMYLKYIENKIYYYKTGDYETALDIYEELVIDLKKGQQLYADVYCWVVEEVLTISAQNEDYDTLIEYLQLSKDTIKKTDSSLTTDILFNKVTMLTKQKEIVRKRTEVALLFMGIIIMAIIIFRIQTRNKQIRKLNIELDEMRKKDGLTKIYNRTYLNEVLEQMKGINRYVNCLMIDIDCFKRYNDYYGHLQGDKILISVAQMIESVFSEDISFRYGGEEFLIISTREQEDFIDNINLLLEEIYCLNVEHETSTVDKILTISCGGATAYIKSLNDMETLIKKADEQLYIAKNGGRNQYSYEE